MPQGTARLLAAVWILAGVFAAGIWTHAQTEVPRVPRPAPQQGTPNSARPTILSGSDIGFRIDHQNGQTPVGNLVVRVNGQWVDVDFAIGMKRLTAR